jgi:Zn-dependent protease
MEEHIRLGRVSGVPVGVRWSLFVMCALIEGSLAGIALPRIAPGYPAVAYWLTALATTVVFYQSLLAHELAHAVIARRAGIRVRGIVLGLLGGVSRLEGQPPSAGVELRVAIAGPAASALLAGMFLAFASVVDRTGGGPLLSGALWWLGGINGLLAAFNLLPAYPLDGGRVLRSALWHWRGDQVWATETAARTGSIFAAGLIGFGLLDAAVAGDLGALSLVLAGGFLRGAARAELPTAPAAPARATPVSAPCR